MEWLWGALATALLGLVAFLFKRFVLEPSDRRKEESNKRSRALNDLKFLLTLSGDAFINQNFKAQTLLRSIRDNHKEIPTQSKEGRSLGYDEIFHRAYSVLTKEEMEIFNLIRGTTLYSMRNANEKMFRWIEEHPEFLNNSRDIPESRDFAEDLGLLREHLDEWLSKFASWMKDDTRSLVYLGDEKKHGPEFPKRIEQSLAAVTNVQV
jgi:hypothetical protein